MLESTVARYIEAHNKYVSSTINAKCKSVLCGETSVSDALHHMVQCPGVLAGWSFFRRGAKVVTGAAGHDLYRRVCGHNHTHILPSQITVHVPDFFEPVEKRFLLRLFMAKGHIVKAITAQGEIREPTAHELHTPLNAPMGCTKKKRAVDEDEVTECGHRTQSIESKPTTAKSRSGRV